MLISEEELNRRLASPKNLVNSLHVVKSISRKYSPRAPESLRVVAGTLAHIDGSVPAVAREMGLSARQVEVAKKLPAVKTSVERVQDLALDMLIDSLGLLTPERVCEEKAKDISAIAANLSRVYSNVRPASAEENRTQILIYAPRQRSVEDFEVVEVRAG